MWILTRWTFTHKAIRLFFLLTLFGATAHAASYYGGALKNHGHSSAPGDGGPLTNPQFLGNITTTGTITANTLNVTGSFIANILSASSMTIYGVTQTAGIDISTAGVLTRITPGKILISGNAEGFLVTGPSNDADSHWIAGAADFYMGITGTSSTDRKAALWGCYNNCTSWPPTYTDYRSTPSITIEVNNTNPTTTGGKVSIKGSIDASEPPTGYIGEFVSSYSVNGIGLAPTTQFKDIAAIALSSGDWDVSGFMNQAGGATSTGWTIGVSTNAGNFSSDLLNGFTRGEAPPANGTSDAVITSPRLRFNFSRPFTVYLKCRGDYSGGTPLVRGYISARRIR